MSDTHIHLGTDSYPSWVRKGSISCPAFPLVNCAADYQTFCDMTELYRGHNVQFTIRYIPRGVPGERHWCFDFPNGYALSVRQFGYGSYSDENSVELHLTGPSHRDVWGDIRGYQDLEALASAVKEASRY